jgi:hypothetical protein
VFARVDASGFYVQAKSELLRIVEHSRIKAPALQIVYQLPVKASGKDITAATRTNASLFPHILSTALEFTNCADRNSIDASFLNRWTAHYYEQDERLLLTYNVVQPIKTLIDDFGG